MRILVPSSNVTGWMCRAMLWMLDRHWPGHPAVVIGGYDRPELPPGVEFHTIGAWADYPIGRWSDGLIAFLEAMPDDIFLYTMDDFWLVDDVDSEAVIALYHHLRVNPHLARIDLTSDRALSGNAQDAGKLRYVNTLNQVVDLDLVNTPPDTPYQLSFQTGLWRRSALLQYLAPGETPAEAEIRGAHRMTRAAANVLGTRQAPVRYKIVQQHGCTVIDDPGYQVPAVKLRDDDRAELERLGYLRP